MTEETHYNKEEKSSYRSIFKATSLFGGVQVYFILIQIIKSKIIAVLLGPLGLGVQGLYHSALELVKQTTSLGISQSAVRDVAEANGAGEMHRVSYTINVLRRIVWFTGLLGTIAVIAFSPLLSNSSFGDYQHIVPFCLLSVILLIEQISAGQKVILQGTRRLKDLAKASAIGATAGLIVSVPFYYYFGIEGIVPTLILTSVAALLTSWFYSRKISIEHVKLKTIEIISQGKSMMVMGLSMSLSGILTTGVAFLLRSLIRKWGGTEDVGLFQAGFVIINSYVGLVFNAISSDYYPRLAAVNKDNEKCKEVVSKQGEISLFLLAPLLSLCIIAMPVMIKILYSEHFLPATGFIKWACVGMLFKLSSWLVSYMFIAKAESKLFIINETIGNVNYLWFCLLGFKLGGLTGLGVAFAINYLIYFIQVLFIANRRYHFSFSSLYMRTFLCQLIMVSACMVCVQSIPHPYNYITAAIAAIISIVYAMKGLDDRIGLSAILHSKFSKK